jgi:hypothetical protein
MADPSGFYGFNTEERNKMYTHFYVKNTCLNKLPVYFLFIFENVRR